MTSSNRGQGSLDAFVRSGATTIAATPPELLPNIRPRSPAKRAREDSDPESDGEEEFNPDRMDFQQAENVTATQAIGDDADHPEGDAIQLPPPLSPEHAALRSDFEIITMTAMERLYSRITADIEKSATDTTMALRKTNDQLRNQVTSLGARITQLQQQVLTYQGAVSATLPAVMPPKQDARKKKEKTKTAPTAMAATEFKGPSYAAMAATAAQTPPIPTMTTNTPGWTTLKVGGQKDKKIPTPKLVPTTYPQAEREVTCHFAHEQGPDVIHAEQDYNTRQMAADTALRCVNSAIVDNKDVFAPAFIRARVTVRGNIVFTTGNTQTNVIYEDYTTIIKDALSYFGECEQVEIGKRHSQFLLHGVPTHLSLPEISQSIASNCPQLIQSQSPRWLTPAD